MRYFDQRLQCAYEGFEISEHMSVAIGDTRILAVRPAAEIEGMYEAAEVLDGRGKLLLPGFNDGHTHTCQQLLKGRTADEYPMIWTRFLVPFESSLTPEDVRVSADLHCLEMIKAGFTGFADAAASIWIRWRRASSHRGCGGHRPFHYGYGAGYHE